MAPGLPSNADALLGSRAIVTMPITPDAAGQVKIGPEIWRAVLSPTAKEAREPGASVIVESVDGVTLIVR
jgi:membrane protein implicated in regulation of membrane protease activity